MFLFNNQMREHSDSTLGFWLSVIFPQTKEFPQMITK